MNKHCKLLAVLSTAAMMTAVTPAFATFTFGSAHTAFAATAGWTTEDGELRYQDSDGYYLTDSWKKKDGEWYYLDENGFVTRSAMIDEYYVDENGKRVYNQWISVDNDDEWDSESPETHWYYYGKDGKSVVSKWQTIEGKDYYFNGDGHMQTGKLELDGHTYYLGAEGDGVMKTGWIQLENEDENLDQDFVWHYFDSHGRMVKDQVDRKIDNAYYTFSNGVMQTGWYKLPAQEAGEGSEETATASEAATDQTPAIASYQHYEEDGKRSDGWRQIEGAPEVHEEGEIFTFYFKNGKPLHAVSGIEVFTVEGKRFGFNFRGEMQTGLQSVNIEEGGVANFYFGDDGIMKTGKQTIYDEDLGDNQTWFFYTDGGNKGRGYHGVRDNNVYRQGLRLEADRDLRYAPADLDGTLYLVNTAGTIQKASTSSRSAAKPELGSGYKDVKDSNDKIWTVNVNGIIQQ